MAWTYNVTQLATNDMMKVRLEIGDTDTTDQLLQDEEITFAISKEASVMAAAARCCELIARKFARQASNKLGPQSVEAQQQYEHYRDEALRLRKECIGYNAPDAGGIYTTDTEPANVKPAIFSKDMMNADYPE